MAEHEHVSTPIGDLLLVAEGDRLAEVRFTDEERRARRRSTSPLLADARVQLEAYFAGERREFALALTLAGSPFFVRVWDAVCGVPFGETRTYGEIAAELGQPRAARAVGLANGRNPLPIIVPCHRLVGAGGQLTGYGGGLERKRWLLDHEARVASAERLGSAA